MKVKIKLYMVYNAESLEKTEELLAAIKQLTNPKIFNADVRSLESWGESPKAAPEPAPKSDSH